MSPFFQLLANVRPDQAFYARKILMLGIVIQRDPQFKALKDDAKWERDYVRFFNHSAVYTTADEHERLALKEAVDRYGNKLLDRIERFVEVHGITEVTIGSLYIRRLLEKETGRPITRVKKRATVH